VILVIIVVIFILVIFFLNTKNTATLITNEGFTAGFRQMYRPHVRNARLIVEGNYNKTKNYFTLMLKKFGII
jgi:hypothetical protein